MGSPLWFLKEILDTGHFPQCYFDIWVENSIRYKHIHTHENIECQHEFMRYALNKNKWKVKKKGIVEAITKTDSVVLKIIIDHYTKEESIGLIF